MTRSRKRILLSYAIRAVVTVILCFSGVAARGDERLQKKQKDAALRMIQASLLSSPNGGFSLDDAKILLEDKFGAAGVEDMVKEAVVLNLASQQQLDAKHVSETIDSPESQQGDPPNESEKEAKDSQVLNDEDHLDLSFYADRHAKELEEIMVDKDCMEREFDVLDPSYDPEEASYVLSKCRVMVLRNVIEKEVIHEFKPEFAKYIRVLKQGKVPHENRVIFDEFSPSKRYEILLPESLAWEDIYANKFVLDVLANDIVLSNSMFMHSFGAVVTEPGAVHQNWHDEDRYIFSDRSFDIFGIGGHDLLPYSVNMFTPMLDLTHDHGPTEFCVGSSALTGLDGGFDVMDKSLVDKGTNFDQMKSFTGKLNNEDQDPCPAQFWRSVLLNVGDVILFDYQIIHRAGQNISPETRAQLYINYSRSWFRDFNYHINEIAEPEGRLSEFTRFAFDTEEEEDMAHCETPNCENEAPLETLRNILPQEPYDDKTMQQRVEFYITNIDLDGATVSLSTGEKTQVPELGQQLAVRALVGTEIFLHGQTGDVVKKWEVVPDLRQIVVSNAVISK